MNVIDVLLVVRFITNQVLPKSPLPLVPVGINRVHPIFHGFWKSFHLWQFAGKNTL